MEIFTFHGIIWRHRPPVVNHVSKEIGIITNFRCLRWTESRSKPLWGPKQDMNFWFPYRLWGFLRNLGTLQELVGPSVVCRLAYSWACVFLRSLWTVISLITHQKYIFVLFFYSYESMHKKACDVCWCSVVYGAQWVGWPADVHLYDTLHYRYANTSITHILTIHFFIFYFDWIIFSVYLCGYCRVCVGGRAVSNTRGGAQLWGHQKSALPAGRWPQRRYRLVGVCWRELW